MNIFFNENKSLLNKLTKGHPRAEAEIKGGEKYPNICGNATIYSFDDACIICLSVSNLPTTKTNIFAFHIHENPSCEGDFSSAGGHFGGDEHPLHKGDLPPIFSCEGNGFLTFATSRFKIEEVVGRTFIIHSNPDDFSSQPAGNSGERIACGIIEKIN